MVAEALLETEEVSIPAGAVELPGLISVPEGASGVALMASARWNERRHPRLLRMASAFHARGIATLRVDLTVGEEPANHQVAADAWRLADRLVRVTRWVESRAATQGLPVGYVAAGTAAAAALIAAAAEGNDISALALRGARVELATRALYRVAAPTLLLAAEQDLDSIHAGKLAEGRLRCPTDLRVLPGAGRLFEGPGMMEQVSQISAEWCSACFGSEAA